MMEPIDFTDCERLPGRAYNGANGKNDLQRQFYKTYLAARYEAMFEPLVLAEGFPQDIPHDL